MTMIPDGLPILARGAHDRASDGACVMEYVSILAGEMFSDSPSCSDNGVGNLAQHINDLLSDGDRHKLIEFIPRLVDTYVGDTIYNPVDPDADDGAAYANLWAKLANRMQAFVGNAPAATEAVNAERAMENGYYWVAQGYWVKAVRKNIIDTAAITYGDDGLDIPSLVTADVPGVLARFSRFLDHFEELTGHQPAPMGDAELFELEALRRELVKAA